MAALQTPPSLIHSLINDSLIHPLQDPLVQMVDNGSCGHKIGTLESLKNQNINIKDI